MDKKSMILVLEGNELNTIHWNVGYICAFRSLPGVDSCKLALHDVG